MMNIITPLPTVCYLACSGGSDSMFAHHFLSRSKRKVIPLYFNHGTEFGQKCEDFLVNKFTNVQVGKINNQKPKDLSLEEFWRRERYNFFSSFLDYPIITVHHLDDQLETMLMGFCHGLIRKIPYKRNNFLRPFLNVTKNEILNYCRHHKIEYLDDPSNKNNSFNRNRIRNNVVPELLKINPGLYKSVRKM